MGNPATRDEATKGALPLPTEGMMLVRCGLCGKIVAGKVPAGGDGSMWKPGPADRGACLPCLAKIVREERKKWEVAEPRRCLRLLRVYGRRRLYSLNLQFEPGDLWLGVFSRRSSNRALHVYVVLVPMCPLHLVVMPR